jgi:thiamine pyrophosphokinase
MRAVIVANGPLPRPPFPRPRITSEDLVVCVDGGAGNALALGLNPSVVIGDMDSIDAELRQHLGREGCLFVEYPSRKDETDTELAVRYALSEGATELLILAALGGRIDHTLANVMLLAIPELSSASARMIDGDQELVLLRDEILIEGRPGDTISLLPLGGDAVGIRTEGLEYPLSDESLQLGASRGVSNVLVGPHARVRVGDGLLLMVHHHRPLDDNEAYAKEGENEQDHG